MDFLICQTSAASPAEPGELLFWFSWACLSAGPHHLALTRSHALFYLVSIFVGSLQTIVNVLTYVLWTSAYRVSCWRGNQGRQHNAAEYRAGTL